MVVKCSQISLKFIRKCPQVLEKYVLNSKIGQALSLWDPCLPPKFTSLKIDRFKMKCFLYTGVVFCCFILSISTALEYKLIPVTKYYNNSFPTRSSECLGNISDAFTNNDNQTLTQKSILSESDEISVTTESDFIEELINDENAFYEYNGDDGISKRSVKLWEINGVVYNKSDIQSMCVQVSKDLNEF